MLVLKIITRSFFGVDHPEGFTTKEEYFSIKSDMQVFELEELIKEKTCSKCNYDDISYEVIRVE